LNHYFSRRRRRWHGHAVHIVVFAKGLAKRGYRVVRFEYPYMAAQRRTGQKKPPDRKPGGG
jgi:predicted alpha/beta-hydrolase family hydrolase